MIIKSTLKITKGWPPARRKAQSARIHITKPWLHSTGPKTLEGKKRSCINAVTHGATAAHWRRLLVALRKQRHFIKEITKEIKQRDKAQMRHQRQKLRENHASSFRPREANGGI